mmetsp:Transcript_73361/g.170186  ORF Transcript_73361/g.170186 Transcript_73361/m.170186 type:complete len:208 (-) Transcript_73361:180-803(-)
MVATMVGEPHLRSKHPSRALHHAGQQPCSVLLVLKEGPAQGGKKDQALQAQLCAVGPLVGTAPREEVKKGLGYALVTQHVPAVGHHDCALLIRRLVGDSAHEVKAKAIARQLQYLLQQPPFFVLVSDVDCAGVHLLQRLDPYGENCGQRIIAEAQCSAPKSGHGRAYGGLHVCGEICVDLQAQDPMQRGVLQELAYALADVLVLWAL